MRTEEELREKRDELIKAYTKLWSEGKGNTEECKIVIAEVKLIEWCLKIEYFRIKE